MDIPAMVIKVKKRKLFEFFVCLWYSNRIGSASALSNSKAQKSPRPRDIAPRKGYLTKILFFERWPKLFCKQSDVQCQFNDSMNLSQFVLSHKMTLSTMIWFDMILQTCLDLSYKAKSCDEIP